MLPGMTPLLGGGSSGFDPSTPLGTATQGGYYLGTLSIGGVTYALIVAGRSAGDLNRAWRNTAAASAGTDSTTDGLANSTAMNNSTHPAAFFCMGLTTGGFSDWYMPAQDELNVLYTNRASLPSGEEFYTASVTGAPYYWSSTQYASDTTRGVAQDFTGGIGVFNSTKANSFRVRAIRRVEVAS